jgi:dolichol-phosphate mannosyltransferase
VVGTFAGIHTGVEDAIAPEPRSPSDARNVSIIVLAYNEQEDLRATIESILEAASAVTDVAVEIIVVDDGSTDATAETARQLQQEVPNLRCVHHEHNRGMGAAIRSGMEAATMDSILYLPGDNLIAIITIRELLQNAGKADFVCAFPLNTELRPRFRQILSSLFAFIYKQVFDLNLRSVHTVPLYRTRQLRALDLKSNRYSIGSEIVVKLLRQGCSYMEIVGYFNPSQNKSSALKLRNLIEVIVSFFALIYEVNVTERSKYSHRAVRITPYAAVKKLRSGAKN